MPTDTAEVPLRAALRYAEMGLYVLPCHWVTPNGSCSCELGAQCEHKGKHPRLTGWQKDASSDPEQIKRWWKQWPRANVGINTGLSGLVAVDVDRHSGGFESLRDVVAQYGDEWLNTWNSSTPRDGEHLLFRCPEGVVIPNSTGTVLGPGIDIKADRGQVVEYPSRTENGLYMWNAGQAPGECELLPLPSWLLQKLTGPTAKAGAVELRERVDVAGIYRDGLPPNRRNNELTRLIGALRHYGVAQELAEAEALIHAERSGLPREEALKVVRSVYSYPAPAEAPAGSPPAEVLEAVAQFPELQALAALLELESSPAEEWELLSDTKLEEYPPPEWLIQGVIAEGGTSVLYGRANVGKSFGATGMALSIASGRPFAGHGVRPGHVVYVSGEGSPGDLGKRVRAWKDYYQVNKPIPQFHVLMRAVQMLNTGEVLKLAATILTTVPKPPKLIVIDTLAVSMLGGDENSNPDMSRFVYAMKCLAKVLGCHVMAVHHAGKAEGATYRGGSSLEGNVDTMMLLSGPTDSLELKCEKQKEGEYFPTLRLKLEKVGPTVVMAVRDEEEEGELTAKDGDVFHVLQDVFPDEPAAISSWHVAAGEAGLRIPTKESFRPYVNRLVKAGAVERTGHPNRARYQPRPCSPGHPNPFCGGCPECVKASHTLTPQDTPQEGECVECVGVCTDSNHTLTHSRPHSDESVCVSPPPLGGTHSHTPLSGCDCSEAHKGQPVGCDGRGYYMTKGPEGIGRHCHQCHPWQEGDEPLYGGSERRMWE